MKSYKYEINSKVYKFSLLKDKDKKNYCIYHLYIIWNSFEIQLTGWICLSLVI